VQPHADWTTQDFLLLEAFQLVEEERCPECGYPVYLCRTDDPDLQFNVRRVTCNATAEVKEESDRATAGDKKLPHGMNFVPVPFSVSGRDLSSFREPYWKAESARRQAILSESEL